MLVWARFAVPTMWLERMVSAYTSHGNILCGLWKNVDSLTGFLVIGFTTMGVRIVFFRESFCSSFLAPFNTAAPYFQTHAHRLSASHCLQPLLFSKEALLLLVSSASLLPRLHFVKTAIVRAVSVSCTPCSKWWSLGSYSRQHIAYTYF